MTTFGYSREPFEPFGEMEPAEKHGFCPLCGQRILPGEIFQRFGFYQDTGVREWNKGHEPCVRAGWEWWNEVGWPNEIKPRPMGLNPNDEVPEPNWIKPTIEFTFQNAHQNDVIRFAQNNPGQLVVCLYDKDKPKGTKWSYTLLTNPENF